MQLFSSQMNKRINTTIKAAILLVTVYSVNSVAGAKVDINALAKKCVVCHGQQGVSANKEWPNLAGQKPGYLAKEITAFRDGSRKNTLMSPMVKGLTDNEVIALANHFSLQVNPSKQKTNENIEGKHIRARCISCHGMKGFTVNNMWPNLAGQQSTYLQNQLLAFKSGQRKSPIMEVIAKELTKQQIADVAQYYSQQSANNK